MHKISKEETIALNVMLLEQRVRKVVVVVTKYAHMLQKVSSDIYLTNFRFFTLKRCFLAISYSIKTSTLAKNAKFIHKFENFEFISQKLINLVSTFFKCKL